MFKLDTDSYGNSEENNFDPIPNAGHPEAQPYFMNHPNYMMIPFNQSAIPPGFMIPPYHPNMWTQQAQWNLMPSHEHYYNFYPELSNNSHYINTDFTKQRESQNIIYDNSTQFNEEVSSLSTAQLRNDVMKQKNLSFVPLEYQHNSENQTHVSKGNNPPTQQKNLSRNSNQSSTAREKTKLDQGKPIHSKNESASQPRHYHSKSKSRDNFASHNSLHSTSYEENARPGIIKLSDSKPLNFVNSIKSKAPIFSDDEFPAMTSSDRAPTKNFPNVGNSSCNSTPALSYTDALRSFKPKPQMFIETDDKLTVPVNPIKTESSAPNKVNNPSRSAMQRNKRKPKSKFLEERSDHRDDDHRKNAKRPSKAIDADIVTESTSSSLDNQSSQTAGFSYAAAALKAPIKPAAESHVNAEQLKLTETSNKNILNKETTKKKLKKKRKVVKIDLEETHKMLQNKDQSSTNSNPKEFSLADDEFPDLFPVRSTVCKTVVHQDKVYDWFSMQFYATKDAAESSIMKSVTNSESMNHTPDQSYIQKPEQNYSTLTQSKSSAIRKKKKEVHLLTMGLLSDKPVATVQEARSESLRKKMIKSEPQSNFEISSSANPLDSKAPSQRRGKEREAPKKKKVNKMKRAILQDREERRLKRLEEQQLSSGQTANSDEIPPDDRENAPIRLDDIEILNTHLSDPQLLSANDSELDEQNSATSESELSENENANSTSCDDTETDLDLHSDDDATTLVANQSGDKRDDLAVLLSQAMNFVSEGNTENSIKAIHSRKFREYCNQIIGTAVNDCVNLILSDLVRFQDRLYHRDPAKFKLKKRMVFGIREVTKYLKLKKIKLVLLAPDIEKVVIQGGLDEAVSNMLVLCRTQSVPHVFTMTRRMIGKLCHKPCPISVVGIFDYSGTETNVKKLHDLVEEARKQYDEVINNVQLGKISDT